MKEPNPYAPPGMDARPSGKSAEGQATADHAESASTASSGRGLTLALVLLGVLLVISITGLGLELLAQLDFEPERYLEFDIPAGMILLRLHGSVATAIVFAAPMAVLRAVLLRKGSSERAVRIAEATAFVALVIGFSVPNSVWLWDQVAGWAHSIRDALDPPPEPSMPISARDLLTAGQFISQAALFKFWVLHSVLVPLALIGVGAAFIRRRRSVMKA